MGKKVKIDPMQLFQAGPKNIDVRNWLSVDLDHDKYYDLEEGRYILGQHSFKYGQVQNILASADIYVRYNSLPDFIEVEVKDD